MSQETSDKEEFQNNKDVIEVETKSGRQIIVKYYLESTKKLLFTNSYPSNYLVASIKKNIERFFNIPFVNIILKLGDAVLNNEDKIGDFQTDNFGVLEITLVFSNVHLKLEPEDVAQIYQHVPPVLPDVLTVQVPTEDRGVYNVVVEVENKCIYKPNLGGYENTSTGIEYHNAYSQTGPYLLKKNGLVLAHRDSQTPSTKNKTINLAMSKATQVTHIPQGGDKILIPRPYETAEERAVRLDIPGKVRFIQKCYRAWKLKKKVKELSLEYKKRMSKQTQDDLQEQIREELRFKKDLTNKAFPMDAEDFDMLYSMIERWKRAEIKRISQEYCGPAKIVEFQVLLDKEIELLHSIDKVRQTISDDIETRKEVRFFKSIGMPIRWNSEYKNLPIEMDTLETQKGRDYFQMYKSIGDKNLSVDEKVDLYTKIKKYFENHKCPTVVELNKLIDRMCTLLARGMSKSHYLTVEHMIEKLMFHHFQLPECNEGVTSRLNKLKEKSMENKLVCCRSCQKLKSMDSFLINARMSKTNICNACQCLNKSEDPCIDFTPYKYILKQVKKYEAEHHSNTSVAFIVTVSDVFYIMDKFWHGKSALSECNDISKLRLVRWNVNEQWSPWNCLPLTVDEGKAHLRIKILRDVYDEHFMSEVFNKLALAKIQFKQLIFVENCLEKN
ncbi:unnamed protein product [Brassicogethes aeneus]|uniref:IQ motif and ubiquitin-like domain-containing protein n=1 Tax=Brassicogethes aeneus TaxID=1431903 RepID=A0A9P0FHU5_BRAAE|nr:unnamed protein product [Brassicogethes aeneus]